MIVSELRPDPTSVVDAGVLMAGASMVFSQDFAHGYLPTPFDPRRDYAQEEISRLLVRVPDGDQISYRFARDPEMVGHLNRDVVSLNLLHPTNYFHFLVESLPTLLVLLRDKAIGDRPMLVSGILHPNMWFALRYATQRLSLPMMQLCARQAVSCDRVILGPHTWHATELISGGVSDSAFNGDNIQVLRETFRPLWTDVTKTPRRKLFIRRRAQQRLLTNVEEAERMAVAAGYTIVDPGTLGFVDQVRIFSSASHILGPTGAWAANLVFARDDAKATIFYPETCAAERNLWKGLGDACGVETEEVYCPISTRNERQPIHSDFVIPPEVLAERL